jgi:toxin CptA
MHSAPSVTYPVGRFFWAAAIPASAGALGVACSALWMQDSAAQGWRLAAVWSACVLTGLWALHAWRSGAVGTLSWSGGQWWWSGDAGGEEAGTVRVALDLQRCLLLSWSGRGLRWLWLERSAAPAHWAALRRAVYSRANPDALPGAEPPSATS